MARQAGDGGSMAGQPDTWAVPKGLKELIGHEFDLGSDEVEAGAIRKFADACSDPNPLWRDKEYARKTSYRGVIAPPTFYHCLQTVGYARIDPELPWKKVTGLNGGNEFEFFKPLRPGDIVSGRARVLDLWGRESKSLGPMLIWIMETIFTNQKGEHVATQRSTFIRYEAKG